MSKPLYYYPHYYYVYLRYLLEYYIPLANNEDLHEVYDNIYVGNISTAYNKDKLKELGITHVVTAISGMSPIYPKDFEYLVMDLLDIKKQKLLDVFDDSNSFIDNALTNGGKVYVHCMCGVSRSVSIVCAYLTKKYNMTPVDALKKIKGIRNVANPNPGFLQQLQNYYTNITETDNTETDITKTENINTETENINNIENTKNTHESEHNDTL